MKFAPYMYTLWKIIILQKKNGNVVPFQNGGQITIFISRYFDFGQNLKKKKKKNIFPKKFFYEIWLKVGEHE